MPVIQTLLAALRRFEQTPPVAFVRRRPVPCIVLLAVLLTSPSLRVGLVIDDYFHRAAILGSDIFAGIIDSPMDMFRFFDGDPVRTGKLIELGMLPWWTDPCAKASFWRPLTVLTHWLDYRLWPDNPMFMHAHSIVWYAVLVYVTSLLYRRFATSASIALLATLLYAVDDARGMPVAFLANRNILPCAIFGILSLLAHDRWRRDGWRPGAVLGPACLMLSLLCKEAGIAACAYLFAYELCLSHDAWRRRLLTLAPYALIVVVWRGVWTWLGHGVENVGLYIDPLGEPWRFIEAIAQRAPLLMLGQWALPSAELSLLLKQPWITVLWSCATAFVPLLCFVLWPILRRDRAARFWALGMCLSILPCCTTFPADRLLFFVGLGGMALLARLWQSVFNETDRREHGRAWARLAVPFACVSLPIHLVLAPLVLPYRAANPAGPKIVETLYLRHDFDEAIERQTLVLVNPPSVLHIAYFMAEREAEGGPLPLCIRQLASGLQKMSIERPDDRTLIIRPEDGWQSWEFEFLFRNRRRPMHVGQQVKLTGMIAEVTQMTDDGRPAEARFRFDLPLEDRSLRWLYWREGEFIPFSLPAAGLSTAIDPGMTLF